MATYIQITDINKIIRKQLKFHFPNTKFSVRKENSSVSIVWTDGPTDAEVSELTSWAKGQWFDSMTDMRVSNGPVSAIQSAPDMIVADELAKIAGSIDGKINLSSDFVFTRRKYSNDAVVAEAQRIEEEYNVRIPRRENNLPSYDYDGSVECHNIGSGAMSWDQAVMTHMRGRTL